jgi:DNA-directed RNA polymerase subunit RPC12/RpoP
MKVTLNMYNEIIAAMILEKLDIECPNCSSILKDSSLVYTCYPVKQQIACPSCGYIGYKYVP